MSAVDVLPTPTGFRDLTHTLADRAALVDQLLDLRAAPTAAAEAEQPAPSPPQRAAPRLKTYAQE